VIGAVRRAPAAQPAPALLTLYATLILVVFGTHLDLYLHSVGRLGGVNLIHLFLAASGPFLLWLLVGPGSDRALGNVVEAVHASAVPLLCFALWMAGHVLFLGGAVLVGEDVDLTRYFPAFQLVVLLFGLALGSAPGFAEALRPAAAAGALLLAGTILYDAFHPGSFSDAQGRAAGVGMNANVAAFDLLLLLAAAVRFREARPLDAALVALCLVAVTFTFSRGGLLLAAVLLALYAASLVGAGVRPGRLAVPAAGLALAALSLPWLLDAAAIADLPDAARRLSALGAREGTGVGDQSRLDLALYYLGLVQQQPLLGLGTGAHLIEEARAPWRDGTHNMYLRVWLDHGLWGLATYLGLLGSALALLVRRRCWPGIALVVLSAANGVFSHNIIDDKTFLLLLGGLLAASALGPRGPAGGAA
jgi:O-antigen ligase